ncbi:MAG: hypothetical protein Q8M29_16860 [Bacteroidota bacterium]|nr:hypothetical protein [Bacteroidota bacterium]
MLKDLYYPAILLPRRLKAVKNIVALGLLLSVLASWKLWTSNHLFPQVPFFNFGFSIGHPYDYILFGLFIASITGILLSRKPRTFIIITLVISTALVLFDQNRLQPWFYMYMLILGVLCFYNWRVDEPKNYTAIYTSITIVIGAIYFWSGVQKLNPNFMSSTWEWFIKPLGKLFTPEEMSFSYKMGYAIPYLEIAMGLGLFFEQTKRIIIPIAITMHIVILIILSPLFHNYNQTVWGWNFCMALLIYFVFAGNTQNKYRQLAYLVEFKPIFLVFFICVCLPVLNLFNKWDSYLSANLYSGNTTNANIYLSEKAKDKLPYYIQLFTKKENNELYTIQVRKWAMNEIGVPGYPETRVFEALQKHIQTITCCDDEVTMFVNEKSSLLADS